MTFVVNYSDSNSNVQNTLYINSSGTRAKTSNGTTFTRVKNSNMAVNDKTGETYVWNSENPNRPKAGDQVTSSSGKAYTLNADLINVFKWGGEWV